MKKFAVILAFISVILTASYANAQARTIVMLHFDKSPLTDECGGTWKAEGNPVISDVNPKTSAVSPRNVLQLDGESYLQKENGIILGGKDFTIDGWVYIDSTCHTQWARIFEFNTSENGTANRILLCRHGGGPCFAVNDRIFDDIRGYIDEAFHFACVYEHEKKTISFYINGELKGKIETGIPARKYNLAYIGRSAANDPVFTGAVWEFRVTEGAALWTENFALQSAATIKPSQNAHAITCPYCGSHLKITVEKLQPEE